MIVTSEGPRIIEMTTRLSGGFDCQYLVPSASGKNILKAAILTSIGKEFDPSLLVDSKHKVSVSGSHWPKPGKIAGINGLTDALQIPGIEKIILRKNVGDTINHYKNCADRVSFIIASGDNLDLAKSALDEALSTIQFDIR